MSDLLTVPDPPEKDVPMPDKYIDRRCSHATCEHKGHYVVMGRCRNCAWEGYLWITRGHTKRDGSHQATCPRCECREIQAGEYVDA